MERRRGSLSAVGVGIRAPAQTTFEVASRIAQADRVFTLVTDPLSTYWIYTLNDKAESLFHLYGAGKDRMQTYSEIVELLLTAVRQELRVCVVAYGHPGVAAYPFHEAVRRARAEGYEAEMLAGVSAEDCLFAELGIDPVAVGCRSYEASDFLLRRRGIDPASYLILWQVGVIAERGHRDESAVWNREGLAVLTQILLEGYAPEHEVIVYEASRLPLCDSMVERVALAHLAGAKVTAMSTLVVPPMKSVKVDKHMVRLLGLEHDSRAPNAASG